MEAEGFICPYCLVEFANSSKLQAHFVEMHSGVEGGAEEAVRAVGYDALGEEQALVAENVMGHQLVQKRMQKPYNCSSCGGIIWQDAFACQNCAVVLHVDGCLEKLSVPCSCLNDTPSVTGGDGVQRSSGPPLPAKGPLALVRRQVAKGRDRFVNDEFDLDLTYITERIIAMSFPASGMESTYRNNLKDVAKMLKTKHQENYMIFNLSERSYDISRFNNQVLDFGWPDHLAPSLERLSTVCRSMKSWLDSDPQHVVVVHCKGGKGRTGCVIAAFMNYSEICRSAEAALDKFAMKRFYDNKCAGVTQPSQRKYVYYFSDLISGKINLQAPPVVLQHVIIHGVPNFDGKGGCRPFLKIYLNMKLVHTSGLYVSNVEKERVKISMHSGLPLQGEVLLKCFHKRTHSGMESIFRCQFHTAILTDSLRLVLKKEDLDDAFKDKRFSEQAKVELLFEPGQNSIVMDEDCDLRSSLLEGKGSNGILRNSSFSKRDSYATFQGGYDTGEPDSVPDLIKFGRGEEGAVRGGGEGAPRKERSESYHMDPEAIQRVAHPNTEQLYTVVTKTTSPQHQAPSPHPPSPSTHDPPYVNQPSSSPLPSSSPHPPTSTSPHSFSSSSSPAPHDKPIVYRKSPVPSQSSTVSPPIKPPKPNPPSSHPHPSHPHPSHQSIVLPSKPVLPRSVPEDDYDEINYEEEQARHVLQVKQVSSGRPTSAAITVRAGVKNGGGGGEEGSVVRGGDKARGLRGHHHGDQKDQAYAEVSSDQQVVLQPATPRPSIQDSEGEAGWVRFKFKSLPSKGDTNTSKRSSSSSNLTLGSSSDYYSNLADLSIGSGFVGEAQRRHSFTEGDDRIVIQGNTGARESLIPVAVATLSEPDYKNILGKGFGGEEGRVGGGEGVSGRGVSVGGREEALYTDPQAASAEEEQMTYYNVPMTGSTQAAGMGGGGRRGGSKEEEEDEDYMNQQPEGLFHTYSNQKELLEQLQAKNHPIPDQADGVATSTGLQPPENKLAAIISLLKNPFAKKTPAEIHSATITETDRQKTLAPFTLAAGAQVGRDYEAFFRPTSAWGDTVAANKPKRKDLPEKVDKPDKPERPERPKRPDSFRGKEGKDKEEWAPRHRLPQLQQVGGREERDGEGQLGKNKRPLPHIPVASAADNNITPSPSSTSTGPSLPPSRRHGHAAIEPKTSVPLALSSSPPKFHRPLAPTTSSHSHLGKDSRTPKPRPLLPPPDTTEPPDRERSSAGKKRVPPKKPPPYTTSPFQQGGSERGKRPPSEGKVRSLMLYWYKPNITREEAIEVVRQLGPGSFIVRDSQTVSGGYALTIKVSQVVVRQRKKLSESAEVTEDMCVTHFLIQPDPEGVKLQGWSERAFKSLPEFIAYHTVDKLCLPCKLVLPSPGGGGGGGKGGGEGGAQSARRRPVTMQEALVTGAACDLVYLGSMDVSGPGTEPLLAQTVEQRKSLDLSVSIVTFKASKEGITISDNVNGLYIKRQYPISSLTYCGSDPSDTRWDFPHLPHLGDAISINSAPCFGVFHRLTDGSGHSCLLFAQFSSSQPVSSILSYLHEVMRHSHK